MYTHFILLRSNKMFHNVTILFDVIHVAARELEISIPAKVLRRVAAKSKD